LNYIPRPISNFSINSRLRIFHIQKKGRTFRRWIFKNVRELAAQSGFKVNFLSVIIAEQSIILIVGQPSKLAAYVRSPELICLLNLVVKILPLLNK
jgi:hypothetical protein